MDIDPPHADRSSIQHTARADHLDSTILLYYDIRIRKEGLDLELLAAELHANAKQAPAWAAQPLPQEQVPTATPTVQEQAPPEEGPGPQ